MLSDTVNLDRDNDVIHTPPPADQIPVRLRNLCEFANREHTGDEFLHPIITACILHFLIGYEHPFGDGNGRTARAVFYWYALRHGYSIFEYMTISDLIRKGHAQYPQAFVDTELDDGDLTYFVIYKMNIIARSLEQLSEHLRQQEVRLRESEQILRGSSTLNLRQRLIIEHALRHPQTRYTVKSHMNSNGISTNTARADLDGLARRKFLIITKRSREVIYLAAPDLAVRVKAKPRLRRS
ncbi:MAG: Fic family protein [Pyrinomonadaceae bacterium]|nr:Fic family protein [Phycisphaerales bacterium]